MNVLLLSATDYGMKKSPLTEATTQLQASRFLQERICTLTQNYVLCGKSLLLLIVLARPQKFHALGGSMSLPKEFRCYY